MNQKPHRRKTVRMSPVIDMTEFREKRHLAQKEALQSSQFHYAIKWPLGFEYYWGHFRDMAWHILNEKNMASHFQITLAAIDGEACVVFTAKDLSVSMAVAKSLIDQELRPTPWQFVRSVTAMDMKPEDYACRAESWLGKQRLLPRRDYIRTYAKAIVGQESSLAKKALSGAVLS